MERVKEKGENREVEEGKRVKREKGKALTLSHPTLPCCSFSLEAA